MFPVSPKKKIGQHFLVDNNIARKIVGYLDAGKTGKVLEVGAGTGMLTQYLLKKEEFELRLVEIDSESCHFLADKFPGIADRLIQDDFLKLDLKRVFTGPFIIIGNFPYNISSQILFKILNNRDVVPEVVCMLQKEMAVRISAPKGSRTYGILSVLLQAFYDVEYLFSVSEHVFYPPPKVKSAVVKLIRNNTQTLNCNEALFFKIVKTAFNQRRKILNNSLKGITVFEKSALNYLTLRPEQLGVEQFVELTNFVDELNMK